MVYFLFFLLLLTILAMLSTRSFKAKQKKKLVELENRWGKSKTDDFNFAYISMYANVQKENGFHCLSEQTKNDIDFNDLFCVLDRTTSAVGQQFLFDALGKPTNDIVALSKFNERVDFFTRNETARQIAQQLLTGLGTNDAYFIAPLLSDNLPPKPTWHKFAMPYIAAMGLLILVSPLYPKLLLWLMIPLSINVFIHYKNRSEAKRFSKSFPQLNILIRICKKLLSKEMPFENTTVKKSIRSLKTIQQKSSLLSFDESTFKDELTQVFLYVFELLKAFFLVEFFAFHSAMKETAKGRADIVSLFEYVGRIDMALSVASLRAGNLKTCEPVFLPAAKKLSSAKLYHPLITECVTNDISVQSKSILITGSNMSGKTTFLRTLALNSILAQTICTCFAEAYATPILKLHSSVRIDDNLLDGKSYYFEEVTVMATLIDQVQQGGQSIFILDEVFKGTNTVERIASAKAILSFLNKHDNIVFVSTHDVELATLLTNEFELYHFAETMGNGVCHFDHKLKTGPLRTSNAIKILAMYNYPPEIIEEAQSISKNLSTVSSKRLSTLGL
jgi:DNA mismatch repair ATPase MutS